MLKKALLLGIICIFLCNSLSFAKYSGGLGTSGDPYKIARPTDFMLMADSPEDFSKYFKMISDIDLTNVQFEGIASFSTPFTGVFDGAGHKILNFESYGQIQAGLFTSISGSAHIKNITLISPVINIEDGAYIGSLVGYMSKGKISNCIAQNVNVRGDWVVGGMVGAVDEGTITGCDVTGSVNARLAVGGLVGLNAGTIIDCQANCDVLAADNEAGGLAGECMDSGLISTSSASGSVEGDNYIGGLVGYFAADSIRDCYSLAEVSGSGFIGGMAGYFSHYKSKMSNCFAAGDVNGTSYVGGLIGYINLGDVENCFWDVNACGQQKTASDKGTGRITSLMQTKNNYIKARWDFVGESVNGTKDIWEICDGNSYPSFVRQFVEEMPDKDETMNFSYLARMGSKWMGMDSCRCAGGMELTYDDVVDMNDLAVFAGNWLRKAGCLDYQGQSPEITISLPRTNAILYKEAAFAALAGDMNNISAVYFHIREPNKGNGVPIGYDNLRADFNDQAGLWQYNLDTKQIADGEYVVLSQANNLCGKAGYSKPISVIIANNMLLTRCSVAAGSKEFTDRISVSGLIGVSADDLNNSNMIKVVIDSQDMDEFVLTFPVNARTFNSRTGSYSYSGTENTIKKSFKYSTKTLKFSFNASKADLSGLACPLSLRVEVADYNSESIADETIVNGVRTPAPMKLMMGIKDVLRVDKYKAKKGNKPDTDYLWVKGAFAVENVDVNMASENFFVTLGSQTFEIPPSGFKAGNGKFTCSKAIVTEEGVEAGLAYATFNLKTCAFVLKIKNAAIKANPGKTDFIIKFADFDELGQIEVP